MGAFEKTKKLDEYKKELKLKKYKEELQQQNYNANTTTKRESEQKYYDMMEVIENNPPANTFIEGVAKPFRRWWPLQKAFAEAGIEQIKKGLTDRGILRTPYNLGMGAFQYVTSPVSATARGFVKEPIKETAVGVGVPEPVAEVIASSAEFAALMATPAKGMTRLAMTPKVERVATNWTKFWSPLEGLPQEKRFVLGYNEAKTAEDMAAKHMKKMYDTLS